MFGLRCVSGVWVVRREQYLRMLFVIYMVYKHFLRGPEAGDVTMHLQEKICPLEKMATYENYTTLRVRYAYVGLDESETVSKRIGNRLTVTWPYS